MSTGKTQWIRKTRLGRMMQRLMGDRAGGVLMEYVVLGLLVVAAVAVAVIGFGDTIKQAFYAMSRTTTGDPAAARTEVNTARSELTQNRAASEAHRTTVNRSR